MTWKILSTAPSGIMRNHRAENMDQVHEKKKKDFISMGFPDKIKVKKMRFSDMHV